MALSSLRSPWLVPLVLGLLSGLAILAPRDLPPRDPPKDLPSPLRSRYEQAAGRRMSQMEESTFRTDFAVQGDLVERAYDADRVAIDRFKKGLALDFDTVAARVPEFWHDFGALWYTWLKIKDEVTSGHGSRIYLENRLKDHLVSIEELDGILSLRFEEFVLALRENENNLKQSIPHQVTYGILRAQYPRAYEKLKVDALGGAEVRSTFSLLSDETGSVAAGYLLDWIPVAAADSQVTPWIMNLIKAGPVPAKILGVVVLLVVVGVEGWTIPEKLDAQANETISSQIQTLRERLAENLGGALGRIVSTLHDERNTVASRARQYVFEGVE